MVKFRVYLLAVAINTPVDLETRKVMDYTNWRAGGPGRMEGSISK